MTKNFLETRRTHIINSKGRPILLKGVNLGGWLMMEGYILHSLNLAEQIFKKKFTKALGPIALHDFEKHFRDHFIREEDFKAIAGFGFNCIRLPFNYRLIEKLSYRPQNEGAAYLDKAIRWAEKYGIYVILDLHAAPGAQNFDWHSDSLGMAGLWKRKDFQNRTLALWEFLADRYRHSTVVAGYDILNEAVTDDVRALNDFYKQIIKTIRCVDKNHILFIEGNRWATDLDCLEEFEDDNYALSIHTYQPMEFVFNFIPHLRYPLRTKGKGFDKSALKKILLHYAKIAQRRSIPVFVGEFGVNNRQGLYGEGRWLKDILACFDELDFHWTYWTWKAVKNNIFPDGIISYLDNPPWVNRQGPALGWDNFARCWPKHKKDMMISWRSDRFTVNKDIAESLRHAAQ